MNTIVIIGGGASGLMTAANLSKQDKTKIIVIDKLNKVGKKILASGNGRCNFTNLNTNERHYNQPQFVRYALDNYGVKYSLNYFESKGLLYTSDKLGRTYPYSYNANTIRDILLNECARNNIEYILDADVEKIIKDKDKFKIFYDNTSIDTDIVIASTGGIVSSNKDNNNYKLFKTLPHRIINPEPALVPLLTPKLQVKGLEGIRQKAQITLIINDKIEYQELGEVLFRKEGLSGIAIFNASLFYARRNDIRYCRVTLDLVPHMSHKQLLDRFNHLNISINDYLNGMFNPRVSAKILKQAQTNDITVIINIIKSLSFDITQTYDFSMAQITVGGIDTATINPQTMESNLVPNLFFIGEALDIDGECGGYNLQWAWSSSFVATNYLNKKI